MKAEVGTAWGSTGVPGCIASEFRLVAAFGDKSLTRERNDSEQPSDYLTLVLVPTNAPIATEKNPVW